MAGRIPQHFIDQLLNRTDIVDLIDSYVPLKKAGANYKANCPFHGEKTPSFTVSPSKQFYHCFGCGVNGTAISFLMDYDHMEFREAIEKLASTAGLDIPIESQGSAPVKTSSEGIDLYQLMGEVSNFYQKQLRQHPDRQQAIDYLKKRGLSGEIAKRFGLGFSPEGWDTLMSELGATAPAQKALLDVGMLTQNEKQRTYDRFRHRIMFPIADHRGRIVGFGGRVLGEGEPKYLNSPETPIFHKGSELYGLFGARGAIKEADAIIVVEGYMDVVALAQAGINHAVATLGTATTPMHLQRLFRHSHNLIFCFDGDRAGRAAAWKALQTCLSLLEDGYQISFLFLPDGEDPDSMVQSEGRDAFLQRAIEAMPLTDFLISSLQQQADLNRLDGRAKLIKLAKPLLGQFPDGVLRTMVVDQLARLTQLSPGDILDRPKQEPPSYSPKQDQYNSHAKRKVAGPSTSIPMTAVRRAISLLLQNPHLARSLPADYELSKFIGRGIELLHQLVTQSLEHAEATTATLLERHRQESHFSALEKLASHDHLLTDEQLEPAFLTLIEALKEQSSDLQLEQLFEKSKHQTLSTDEKQKLSELLSQSKNESR